MILTSNCKTQILSPLKGLCLGTLIAFTCLFSKANAQEIGYVGGLSSLGIDAKSYQPLYGFSIGYQFNKYLGLETNLFYSQRTIGSSIQADYISFLAMPKIGYFGKKVAFFYGPAILLNPTLHHSNIENHTYLSTYQSIGFQYKIMSKLAVDLKLGYDIGLTGAYFTNGSYQKYSGPMVLLGIKMLISQTEKKD